MPDQATVRRALERAEFVVVQEAFATTATCAYADLLLPATTWGEKDGTVTNSERRISRVRAGRAARPARRAHDWAIAVDFARRLEPRAARPGAPRRCSPTPTPESVWNEHREIHARPRPRHHRPELRACSRPRRSNGRCPRAQPAAARACTKTASSPRPTAAPASSTRAYKPVAEPRDARYPVLAHHRPPARPVARHEPHRHAGPAVRPRGRAGGADASAGHGAPPADATATWCTCTSRRGSIVLPVAGQRPTSRLSQAFIAMHWGEEYLSGRVQHRRARWPASTR